MTDDTPSKAGGPGIWNYSTLGNNLGAGPEREPMPVYEPKAPLRLCKDCSYCDLMTDIGAMCHFPGLRSPVDGERVIVACLSMRAPGASCGPTGALWEAAER